MASFHVWLEVLSYVKSLFEAITLGVDVEKAYVQHRAEQATITEARRVSRVYSTYSDAEIEAILKRLKRCAERFVAEGSGQGRKDCLCSVFKDVIDGNGGSLPHIDDWDNIFRQLNCPKG